MVRIGRNLRIKIYAAIIIIAIIVTFTIAILSNNVNVKGFQVQIENSAKSNSAVMYISCKGLTQDIRIPNIKSNKMFNLNISPKNYGENSITLYYYDKTSKVHHKSILGYFEESYGNGIIKIRITKVNEKGEMTILSKYHLNGFYEQWYGDEF